MKKKKFIKQMMITIGLIVIWLIAMMVFYEGVCC